MVAIKGLLILKHSSIFTYQFGKHFENWLVLVIKWDKMGTAIYDW